MTSRRRHRLRLSKVVSHTVFGATGLQIALVGLHRIRLILKVSGVQIAKRKVDVIIVGIEFEGLAEGLFGFARLAASLQDESKRVKRVRVLRRIGRGLLRCSERLIQIRSKLEIHIAFQHVGMAMRGNVP